MNPGLAYRSGVLSDKGIVIFTILSCVLIYVSLSFLLPKSQIPTLVAVFIGSNMLSRTNLFKYLVNKIEAPATSSLIPRVGKGIGYDKFKSLSESSQVEVLSAIKSLQAYSDNTKKTNDRRRKLFKMMSWRQQRICEEVGYLKKLTKIDQSIVKNQKMLSAVVENSVKDFGLSFKDFDLLNYSNNNSNNSSTNYRVVEALGHYMRDWSREGDVELKHMLLYIKQQLNEAIPVNERANTCIIVPGSGLGRIAHEIASIGDDENSKFGAVHAVEYSGLMHLCNQFIYSTGDKTQQYDIYPYIHSCSNFTNSATQFRPSTIHVNQSKPKNLSIDHEDFRYFHIPDDKNYVNVIVVSAFFIDTAENLIDYMDCIQRLTSPSKDNSIKNGYWINIGPLKYGTAARVELNVEELSKVRKEMGWNDINSFTSIEHSNSEDRLVGYMTDTQSMWQGYYGLNMWNSQRKENKAK